MRRRRALVAIEAARNELHEQADRLDSDARRALGEELYLEDNGSAAHWATTPMGADRQRPARPEAVADPPPLRSV